MVDGQEHCVVGPESRTIAAHALASDLLKLAGLRMAAGITPSVIDHEAAHGDFLRAAGIEDAQSLVVAIDDVAEQFECEMQADLGRQARHEGKTGWHVHGHGSLTPLEPAALCGRLKGDRVYFLAASGLAAAAPPGAAAAAAAAVAAGLAAAAVAAVAAATWGLASAALLSLPLLAAGL